MTDPKEAPTKEEQQPADANDEHVAPAGVKEEEAPATEVKEDAAPAAEKEPAAKEKDPTTIAKEPVSETKEDAAVTEKEEGKEEPEKEEGKEEPEKEEEAPPEKPAGKRGRPKAAKPKATKPKTTTPPNTKQPKTKAAQPEDNMEEDKPEEAAPAPDDKPPADDTPTRSGRSKRARKSAETFAPDNFRDVDRSLPLVKGRGTRLADLAPVAAAIQKHASNSDELLMAHRLLFTMRGKPSHKDIKAHILAFHGFLSERQAEEDPIEREQLDEEAEKKMSIKAYKLTIPQLKAMCDLFVIDRQEKNGKDALVDCLLDFLGAPSETMLKGYKRTASEKASKRRKSEPDETEKDDEKDDYEEIERGTMPTDDQLRQWTRAYIRCFNMENVTIKHALEVAGDKFGVDLADKKNLLKDLLTEEM